MIKPTIEEILAPKPEANPRIYAYAIESATHTGLLKIGQTTRNVKQRIAEQVKTAAIPFRIELDESAARDDGTTITDHAVRAALVKKGFSNPTLEWVQCTVADVKTVLTELRIGKPLTGTHHETFPPRREQADAVDKTFTYFQSIWKEDGKAVPRFLWNAKMRFGKTFTSYQLAKKLKAKRVLVLTSSLPLRMPGKRTWKLILTSTGGNIFRASRNATPARSKMKSQLFTLALFKTSSAATKRPEPSNPGTNGCTPSIGIWWCLMNTTSAPGATRPRSFSKAKTTRNGKLS
jgi:hypothetical protein